jgi:lipoate-protein ligase A
MRRAGALLQHGSILIEPRIDRLAACLNLPNDARAIEDGVAGLAEVGVTEPVGIASAIAEGVAARFGVSLIEGQLRSGEAEAAQALAAAKYQSARWTERRAPVMA